MSQSARPVSAKNAGELQQPQVGAGALGTLDSVSAIKFDPRGNHPTPPSSPLWINGFFSDVTHSKLKFWQVCLQFCLFVATSCFNWVAFAYAKVWSHKRALKELEPWCCWGLYPRHTVNLQSPETAIRHIYIICVYIYIYRNIYIYYIYDICISSITVFSTFSILTSSDHIIIYYHVEFSRNGKNTELNTELRSCQAPGRETPPQSQATTELWTQTFRSWYPQDLFFRRKKFLAPVPLPIQALWILMGVFLWK